MGYNQCFTIRQTWSLYAKYFCSRDIRSAMVGARGFTADYALLVTWERMGYGGTPKSLRLSEYENVKRSVSGIN